MEDLGLIPGLGRSRGEGEGYPLQCSGLESSMDCIVREVAKLETTERLARHCLGLIAFIGESQGTKIPQPCSQEIRVLWERILRDLLQPRGEHYVPLKVLFFFLLYYFLSLNSLYVMK